MVNDDSNSGKDEDTKQVGHDLLNKALNKSVDRKEIINRVNAEVGKELSDDEGTAKVERESVRQYLEAARAGSPAPPGTPPPKIINDAEHAEADETSPELTESTDLIDRTQPDVSDRFAEPGASPTNFNQSDRTIPSPPSHSEAPGRTEGSDSTSPTEDTIESEPTHDHVGRHTEVPPMESRRAARLHEDPVQAVTEDHSSSTGSLIWFGMIALFGILLGVAIGVAYIVITGG